MGSFKSKKSLQLVFLIVQRQISGILHLKECRILHLKVGFIISYLTLPNIQKDHQMSSHLMKTAVLKLESNFASETSLHIIVLNGTKTSRFFKCVQLFSPSCAFVLTRTSEKLFLMVLVSFPSTQIRPRFSPKNLKILFVKSARNGLVTTNLSTEDIVRHNHFL